MFKRILPLLLAMLIVVVDRWSKVAVQRSMTSFDSTPIIAGWLRVIHTENAGAAFGILANGNRWLRSGILIGVSSVVLLFVVAALWGKKATFTSLLARAGLGFILGGALGNLYDRIISGTVTDFIEVYHGTWSFPAFNVADSAITIGAILLLLEMLFGHDRSSASGRRAQLVQN